MGGQFLDQPLRQRCQPIRLLRFVRRRRLGRFRLRIRPRIGGGDLLAFALDRLWRRLVFGPNEPPLDPHGAIVAETDKGAGAHDLLGIVGLPPAQRVDLGFQPVELRLDLRGRDLVAVLDRQGLIVLVQGIEPGLFVLGQFDSLGIPM